MARPPFEVSDDDEEPASEDGLILSYVGRMPTPLAVQISTQTQGQWRPDLSRTAESGSG